MASDKNLVSLTAAEHIGPEETGDNIGAKRVASYGWDGANWQRQGILFSAGKDFDHLDITNSSADEDTLVYKNGGSTVRTLVIVYATGAEKVSDSLTSLDYS